MNKLHWIFRYIIGVTLMAYTFGDYLGNSRFNPVSLWLGGLGSLRTNANSGTVERYSELQKYNDYIAQGLSPEEAEASVSIWDRNPISSLFGSAFGTDYAKRATLAMMLDNTGKVKVNDPKVDKLLTIGKALDRTNWAPWDSGTTEGNFTLGFSEDAQAEIPQYLIDLYDNDPNFKTKIDLAARETNQGLGQKINTELSGMQDDFKAWKNWKAGNGTWRGKSNDSEGTPVNTNNGTPVLNNKKETDVERITRETQERLDAERDAAIKDLQAKALTDFEVARSTAKNGMEQKKALDTYNKTIAEGMAKIPGTKEYGEAQAQKKYAEEQAQRQKEMEAFRGKLQTEKEAEYQRHLANPSDMHNRFWEINKDPNFDYVPRGSGMPKGARW
jgi:hypothetical protein